MTTEKDKSDIEKAKELIASVKGKPMGVDQRKNIAIELAALILNAAQHNQTKKERRIQAQLSRMMDDPVGKNFMTQFTDQGFRSHNAKRVANQLQYILHKLGVPQFLSWGRRAGLYFLQWFGGVFPQVMVPLTKRMLRQETSQVILPGEKEELSRHMAERKKEGIRINLNHLGEAILGEDEAKHRLQIYLDDLAKPEVEYVSIKISTICSQINLLAWEDTLAILSSRLKSLYRAAQNNLYVRADGTKVSKFVNLDMEEYRDLLLTVELFKTVLDDEEFKHHSAGIVLQAYLPDSFAIQQELTDWAARRVAAGGAPIKIRLVKGANLAMEQVEAALRLWPQAPYDSKTDVDANFKRMLAYGCIAERAYAAHLGVASHNVFDIAYALLLRAEDETEAYVSFEMLEGMADPVRRVVQELSGGMLLYCPTATEEEFQNAVAYLVRRLDENTAPENFLRHAFHLTPGSAEWKRQADAFSKACLEAGKVSHSPRRQQNRFLKPDAADSCHPFQNEPDTDWSLPQNRKWAEAILDAWSNYHGNTLPLQIGGSFVVAAQSARGEDPSRFGKELYRYSLAAWKEIDHALDIAVESQKNWQRVSLDERIEILGRVAHQLKIQRGKLLGCMVADTGKTLPEADVEISEAIDFAEYYRRNVEEISLLEDIRWEAKGVVLVASPWNFPCSIPAGGILAALAAGNSVLFKPAPEAVLTGWELVNLFWKAGVSKEVLQFITCEDEPVGSQLIKDPRISAVILTGATATAKRFLKMRPGLDLLAETGGKNAIIVTNLSDRDLAVRDIVQSAFGYAGQKCSACSLVICEREVYHDPVFREQLRDAAASLRVGTAWNLATKMTPLIRQPNATLAYGLTTLDPGEEWLLRPQQDPENPNLWSPGIKLGVKEGSASHQQEFFGPVLSVMCADNLSHALKIANGTSYGLTSGLHSLDEREHRYWKDHIEAGNCYINRGITGAIVQRQPFGGCKESHFGPGSKAGGPNYLMQLMNAEQFSLPRQQESATREIRALGNMLTNAEELNVWQKSIGSYAFFWKHYFSKSHDPSKVQGQDNLLEYVPQKQMVFRIQSGDKLLDILRVQAAALTCGALLEISGDHPIKGMAVTVETEEQFIKRLQRDQMKRIRFLRKPSQALQKVLAHAACNVLVKPVMANGRVELLNYLREVSFSVDYHRYGNLGEREGEKRAALAQPAAKSVPARKAACAKQTCCCS